MRGLNLVCFLACLAAFAGCAPAPVIRSAGDFSDTNDLMLIELGRKTFTEKGCIECHVREGAGGKSAPNLDLTATTADPTHVRESILLPDRRIAPGFEAGLMPQNYGSLLTEAEIDALQYYLSNEVQPGAR